MQLFVSSRTASTNLGNVKDLAAPMVVCVRNAFSALGFGQDFDMYDSDTIRIASSQSSLIAGLSGNITIYNSTKHYNVATSPMPPGAKVDAVALNGQPALFHFDTGDEMADGFIAPHCRVGLFFVHDHIDVLTPQGFEIILASLEYSFNCTGCIGDIPVPDAECIDGTWTVSGVQLIPSDVTFQKNLTVSSQGVLALEPEVQVTVYGCFTLDGTLVVNDDLTDTATVLVLNDTSCAYLNTSKITNKHLDSSCALIKLVLGTVTMLNQCNSEKDDVNIGMIVGILVAIVIVVIALVIIAFYTIRPLRNSIQPFRLSRRQKT
eukprot:CAMPEP_0168512540 /NCGR_PEP_ID=MMETSP0405-20121227/2855_1 /TAXON_ID=498012 /ORGANISM="Trichosphaerium sp, Strain Am-I-7 wt" /LENGTH=319 /DNA_ID=CAMNT_0008531055 /DNA_START=155 /DNA_END=1111 /DNA_ORIENTATION=+